MIDRKQLDKKLALSLQAISRGVTDTVDFLENRAPGQIEALGKALHDRADRLNLYKPRRRGMGFSLLMLVGAAAVTGYLLKSGKLSI